MVLAQTAALSRGATRVSEADLDLLYEAWNGGISDRTKKAYDDNLTAFGRWLVIAGRAEVSGPRDVISWLLAQGKLGAEAALLAYLNYLLKTRGLAPATVRHHRAAVRSAIEKCEDMALVTWRVRAKMARGVERGKRRQTEGPSFKEFGAMLQVAAAQWQPKAARDVAMLRLMADLRVRESEICKLNRKDYGNGTIFLKLKGHAEGVSLTVPRGVQECLRAYLDQRGEIEEDKPLFASCDAAGKGSGRLTRFGLHRIVKKLGEKAALAKPVSPHRLLHTASTALADAGVSTDRLQWWGRWEKADTAHEYTDSKKRVAEQVANQLDEMTTDMLKELAAEVEEP
jgi:integrase/recombinase XerC